MTELIETRYELHPPKAADMVVVVRCRDCRFYKIVDEIYLGDGEVEEIFGCAKFDVLEGSDPFGFCAWRERRVDE